MKTTVIVVCLLLAGFVLISLPVGGQTGGFPAPNDGGTHLTYDSAHRTYHLTRTDGTFGSVLRFENSAAPGYPNTNDFSTEDINVDGQTNLCTYHWFGTKYIVSSCLNLDQDGHFSLGGGNLGGIANDPGTGETCIPTNVNLIGNCNVPTALKIGSGGQVTSYLGLTVSNGNGISTNPAHAGNTALTGNVSDYVAWITPASGYGAQQMYEIVWVGVVVSASPGATAFATWNFTDDSGRNSCSSPSLPFGALGDRIELTCHFFSVPNSQIRLSVTIRGGSPTYSSQEVVLIH
jgi:hypothetical protein